jgi:CRISPR system Cascade subunit CasE
MFIPPDVSARTLATHRLVWTLFADAPDRERDFLWREADTGVFYLLSRRRPEDRHGLFDVDQSKVFSPRLGVGDRLTFMLRANATVSRQDRTKRRGVRCDVVMDAIYQTHGPERALARRSAIESAGIAWLAAQGAKAGFVLPDVGTGGAGASGTAVSVTTYRTLAIERPGAPARLGVLDFEGVLEVRDPALLIETIGTGFGRAKAFGCGLMLIRRV